MEVIYFIIVCNYVGKSFSIYDNLWDNIVKCIWENCLSEYKGFINWSCEYFWDFIKGGFNVCFYIIKD